MLRFKSCGIFDQQTFSTEKHFIIVKNIFCAAGGMERAVEHGGVAAAGGGDAQSGQRSRGSGRDLQRQHHLQVAAGHTILSEAINLIVADVPTFTRISTECIRR